MARILSSHLLIGIIFCLDEVISARVDPYKVLGVSHSATEHEIKHAYHKLALKWHPDKHDGNEEKFIQIKNAYESLDPRKGQPSLDNQHRTQARQPRYHHYHYQQRAYRTRPHDQHTYRININMNEILIAALVIWLLYKLWVYGSNRVGSAADNGDAPSTSRADPKSIPKEEYLAQPSPFITLAKKLAPSVYEFRPQYMLAGGRRLVIYFVRDGGTAWNCDIEEQFIRMENLAAEFRRDAISFYWLDLVHTSAHIRSFWYAQFERPKDPSPPIAIACNHRARKISRFRGEDNTLNSIRQWICSLLEGGVTQLPAKGVLKSDSEDNHK